MFRYLLYICAFSTFCMARNPGPEFPPTKGEVWPKPQHERKEDTYYTINPSQFSIKIKGNTCDILTRAVQRYSVAPFHSLNNIIKHVHERKSRNTQSPHITTRDENYMGNLKELQIDLTEPCEDYPYFGMDESYNLTVAETSNLTSASVWGVLRGLETFAQLFYLSDNYDEIRINTTSINDYPQYEHRGLLIDTARHYISMKNIFITLDAMAINKMNVLHWHIVDDESFPYQSEKFPDLSKRGSFHPSMVYTKDNIKKVINYARDRGIRVLPEFDMPGHTESWGMSYPNILTQCYEDNKVSALGPMNPIHNMTYKIIRDLFQELQELFPDKYVHIGGDEVDLNCWSTNPDLIEYMNQHNLTSVNQLHALFMENIIPLLDNKSKPIVWQEVFDEGVALSDDTLVQVWKWDWQNELIRVLSHGHKVLFSSAWYLDHLVSGGDWNEMYKTDPRKSVNNSTLAVNIVGGEACMWGEVVDDWNIISRVWPRASAVAERLWSPPLGNTYMLLLKQVTEARHRMEEHTCRMIRRGIHAQPPNGPGYCLH